MVNGRGRAWLGLHCIALRSITYTHSLTHSSTHTWTPKQIDIGRWIERDTSRTGQYQREEKNPMLYVYSLITFHLNFDFTANVWYRLCRALFLFQQKVIILLLFHVQSFCCCCCCMILCMSLCVGNSGCVCVCKSLIALSFGSFFYTASWFHMLIYLPALSLFHSLALPFQLLFKLAKRNVFVVRLLDCRTFFTSGLSVRVSSCCSGCSSSFSDPKHTHTYTYIMSTLFQLMPLHIHITHSHPYTVDKYLNTTCNWSTEPSWCACGA